MMKPKILHLNSNIECWEEIRDGKQQFEIRRINNYWKKRLVDRHYDEVWVKCGYPKTGEWDKILRRKWNGCEIKTAKYEGFDPHKGTNISVDIDIYAIDVSEIIE